MLNAMEVKEEATDLDGVKWTASTHHADDSQEAVCSEDSNALTICLRSVQLLPWQPLPLAGGQSAM